MIPSSLLSAKRIRPFTRWSELSELSVPGPVGGKMPRVALRAMVFAFPTAVAVTLALTLTLTFAGGGASAYAAPPRHGADYAAEAAKSKELGTALADYQESNYPVALREFKAEAERGNRIAQFDYAMMLLNGEGTDPDLPNALIWLQKAAHAGMSHAQFIYGQLYDSGQVVEPNPKLAHYWFLKAAEQGHVDAEVALATQYMDGRGTPRSYAEAFDWYLKAAKNGDEASQYIVASFYERGGDGVKVDLNTARVWYALAAAQGDPAAAGKYTEISERLQKAGHTDPDDRVKPNAPHSPNTL